MKKLVFTALVVVAFSGVAMANTTVEVKEVNNLEIRKEVLVLKATACQGCYNYAMDQTDLEEFASDSDAHDFYQGEFEHCYSHGGC